MKIKTDEFSIKNGKSTKWSRLDLIYSCWAQRRTRDIHTAFVKKDEVFRPHSSSVAELTVQGFGSAFKDRGRLVMTDTVH